MNFQLMQVKNGLTRDFGWMCLEERAEVLKTETIDLSVYETVYEGVHDASDLDSLWVRFNSNHPEGFTGRSMSVGDIVLSDGRYWYCDRVGFVDVTDRIAAEVTL